VTLIPALVHVRLILGKILRRFLKRLCGKLLNFEESLHTFKTGNPCKWFDYRTFNSLVGSLYRSNIWQVGLSRVTVMYVCVLQHLE